jgi:hypothetical protein
VRLVDGEGRRWGTAESTVYPSSSWRNGERAVGLARLEVEPSLPPGEYRLVGGFTSGTGSATTRLLADGAWGGVGLGQALGPDVRLVSRSAPLSPDSLTLDRRLDETVGSLKLIGVDFDRETARAGERVRVTLYWQSAGRPADQGPLRIVLTRPGGSILQEWPHVPVDGAYPPAQWKPGEIVRDTRDLIVPASLSPGEVELAIGTAGGSAGLVSLGRLAVEDGDRQLTEPDLRARLDVDFTTGERLIGLDYKGRRVRAGDTLAMTLVWRTAAPSIPADHLLSVALLDESGRILAQQESEPAGGKRPISGWTPDEYVEDGWKFRLPRELPRGRVRLAVSVIDTRTNQYVPTTDGRTRVELPIEVGGE